MATYPAGIYSHTTIVDGSDYPRATHVNTPAAEIVAIETELGTNPRGSAADVKTRLSKALSDAGHLDFATSTELTIVAGAVTVTQNWHTIDTEADAASDDLDTLTASGVSDGFVLFLRANNTARTVVVKHNTGNIVTTTAADLTLNETYKAVIAIYDATLLKWIASMPIPPTEAGSPAQAPIHTQTGTFTSLGTTQIPLDDTIPASTEGNAVTALDTTITPTSATNKLLIEVTFIGAHSAGNVYVCLFQDAGAAALKVAPVVSTADALVVISFQYEMTAGTTSATTFKLRAGSNAVGTMYFNGRAGAQVFGGVLASSMRITEIKV